MTEEERMQKINEHYEQEKAKLAKEEMQFGNMNYYLKKEEFIKKAPLEDCGASQRRHNTGDEGKNQVMKAESLTRDRAIYLINYAIDNYTIFYEGYCNNNWNHLTGEEMEFYEQMHEVISILRNSEDYKNDLKNMPLEDLKEFLLMCKTMVENNSLSSKSYFPKGDFEIAEDEKPKPELNTDKIKNEKGFWRTHYGVRCRENSTKTRLEHRYL